LSLDNLAYYILKAGICLVEVMDGQHRIKALEAYIQATGAAEEELW
jgi:hypothetical protein